MCPNGRKVTFNKKNPSGYEQSFKIYECEDCTDCPLKAKCTKAKGNRQIHWNTVFEEMKAKAKTTLECEEKAASYFRRKIEKIQKQVEKNGLFFSTCFILGTYQTASFSSIYYTSFWLL
ncbi:transposase [Anoxybacteroides rupiense]|uniref:transposase n=1 Tax=Anoxybacteroides rupiense TaxID=311460 RepID=UPI0035E43068